jgi:hypothetical protein
MTPRKLVSTILGVFTFLSCGPSLTIERLPLVRITAEVQLQCGPSPCMEGLELAWEQGSLLEHAPRDAGSMEEIESCGVSRGLAQMTGTVLLSDGGTTTGPDTWNLNFVRGGIQASARTRRYPNSDLISGTASFERHDLYVVDAQGRLFPLDSDGGLLPQTVGNAITVRYPAVVFTDADAGVVETGQTVVETHHVVVSERVVRDLNYPCGMGNTQW